MPLPVFFPQPLTHDERTHLQAALRGAVALLEGPELPDPADYQVLVSGHPERSLLAASPGLRAVIVPWAGIPPETRTLLRDFPGVTLHNLHHNAEATAEMALALLLAAAKRVVPLDQRLRRGDWRPRYDSSQALLLAGRTVLILGYGHIGRHVGRVCRAMGMQVLATRRHPEQSAGAEAEVHPPEALHDLLPRADVLVITLPQTSETEGLIGARELALLPDPALLVNVGRGPIVEERALYDALREGRLHAAGLDVWYRYPEEEATRAATLPSSYPFHELENVVMSPHRGGAAMQMTALGMEHLARLLEAAARGEPIPNRVDMEQGY